MTSKIALVFCLLVFLTGGLCKSADEWKSRVIYQLLTDRFASESDQSSQCSDLRSYCGGTFNGIAEKLDYIQGLGANAIWISPIPLQTDGGYHGYWQQDITKINPNFGTSDDLKNLINACHQRDIWVMLDIVGNHVGNQKNGDWSDFTKFVPFNQSQHYHSYCIITDFTNQDMVEKCRLANLPDLNQDNDFVRSTLKSWIHRTVITYKFDGIRVDTTPEVHPDFWSEYSAAAGVFSIGEVFNGDPKYVSKYQGPLSATLNYPMYYKLKDAFQSKSSMREIHDGVNANSIFSDVSVLGTFVDNHDNPRFLSQNSDWNTLLNAMAYTIFAEGIPIIYYGTEQGFKGPSDPNNRESLWPHYDTSNELYTTISKMAKFRNSVGTSLYTAEQVERYVDDQFFAFTRGNVLIATSNVGSGQSFSRTITFHPYSDGTKLVNLLDSSDTVTVDGGKFLVNIKNGLPVIYHPLSSVVDDDVNDGRDGSHSSHTPVELVLTGVIVPLVAVVFIIVAVVCVVIIIKKKKLLHSNKSTLCTLDSKYRQF